MLALHHMNHVVGVLAVPTTMFEDFQKAIAGISIADVRPSPPPQEQGST